MVKEAVRSNNTNSNNKITPFMLDLRKNYDYNVLKRFYNELMIPNFPKEDELEPLDNWVEMFQDGISNTTTTTTTTSISNDTTTSDQQEQQKFKIFDPVLLTDVENTGEVVFHIILAICPKELKTEKQKSDIMGGVVFEFYPTINCGCITYLLVNDEYRGQGLAGLLIREATEKLMENGRNRGHFGGCNAIFLETNSADKVSKEDDVMDPAQRHSIFHRLGIRLLDFDYVQPPLSKELGKCRDLLLTCLLTPNIPKTMLGKEEHYYLPSTLLKKFLKVFWYSCCQRLDMVDWEQDVDYKRMMDQVDRREKISLLDLPWERPWTLLDLRESYDSHQLIVKFYNELLVPNFSGPNELESLENWLNMLPNGASDRSASTRISTEDFHLLVALRYPDDDQPESSPIICGGLAFEYHRQVNCGLLTYFLVGGGPNNRSERMARALIQRAVDILDQNAIDCGHLAGCNAIFLETTAQKPINSSKLENSNEIAEISYKQEFLETMGWRKVDFCYSQPPLSFDKKPSKSLVLVVLITPRIPQFNFKNNNNNELSSSSFSPKLLSVSTSSKIQAPQQPKQPPPPPQTITNKKPIHYLPNTLLINFTKSFWNNTCIRNGYWHQDDEGYRKMIDSLSRREKIPLLSMPWQNSIIFVDLSTDFHLDLFDRFYNSLPSDHNFESRSQLLHLLTEQKDFRSKVEDIHLVLALTYRYSQPTILGAILFSYFVNSNCGLISKVFIKNSIQDDHQTITSSSGGIDNLNIAKELLDEAVDILNRSAKPRTHISGPNAIFLETSLDSFNYKYYQKNNNNLLSNNNNNGIIDHQKQSAILQKMTKFVELPYRLEFQSSGWYLLDLEYYQPPRNLGNPAKLSILNLFRSFLSSYWSSIFTRNGFKNQTGAPTNIDSFLLKMLNDIKNKEKIYLHMNQNSSYAKL
eukprot:gene11114-13598_t